MSREWKPGDVAEGSADEGRMFYIEPGVWMFTDGSTGIETVNYEARPLVVIDPEEREQVERLDAAIEAALADKDAPSWRGPADCLAVALRSLIEPPKPTEPTTFGVVEASCVHSEERRPWMRDSDGNWWPVGPYDNSDAKPERFPDDWGSLVAPTVIRDGVS